METDTMTLRNIPPRLKGKIARRVENIGTNMNDVLVGVLAEAFDIEFEPTGVRRLSIGDSPAVLLKMPVELKRAIKDAARARDDDSMQNVVLEILSREFRVAFRRTGRWERAAA